MNKKESLDVLEKITNQTYKVEAELRNLGHLLNTIKSNILGRKKEDKDWYAITQEECLEILKNDHCWYEIIKAVENKLKKKNT
jgi:hypothetical protein